ncbi:MAG TPA: CRTAC1 family protein [Rhodothermales bacterium]|nr:CRTAC1 family protein [Rhodothermales bacterium]
MKFSKSWVALFFFVAGCAAQPEAEQPPTTEPEHTTGLHFTEVVQEAGLGDFRHETGAEGNRFFPESMGSGCGFIDYDGDGWIDILAAGGGTWPGSSKDPIPSVWLYRNNGDGTFSLATQAAGLDGMHSYSLGFAVADYDNDGDQDFYLSTLDENRLYRNEGGVFTEVARTAGVAGEPVWSSAPIFFDADRDGWLDLYVGNYVEWSPETDLFCTLDGETKDYCTPQTYTGLPGRYYHNNGDGTFIDRTEQAGFLVATGKALGVIELDVNQDGLPDLMVANDTDPNQLFVNQGDGTFAERGAVSGLAYDETGKTRAGMGIDAGVVDSTGEVSIFVGHFTREMIGVWRHRSNGSFVERAAASKIGRPSLQTLTFGLFLLDADLDGHLDLFAANGHVNPGIEQIAESFTYAEPAHLFINRGDGTFEDVAPTIGGILQEPLVARGAAYADYDRDGDLDILLTENAGGLHLWRNDLNSDAYLRVHVEGHESNRSGLGTRLVAVAGNHRMERRLTSGTSYLAASELVATFGLGSHLQVDSLIVYWPSGRIDRLGPLEAGQDVLLVEGASVIQPLPYEENSSVAENRR